MGLSIIQDRSLDTLLPRGDTRTIYVRNSGSDDNPGTLALPLATLPVAFSKLSDDRGGYARQVIDVTGYTNVTADILYASFPASSRRFELVTDRDTSDGKQDFWDMPIEIVAEPVLVQNVTVTGESADATTGLPTINVSDTLVVDAHVGQMFLESRTRRGVIHSNTVNTLVIASWSNGFAVGEGSGIYTQSCTLDFGDPTKSFCGIWITVNSGVVFNGIKFENTQSGNCSFGIVPKSKAYFNMCHFTGVNLEPGTLTNFWYCYFQTKSAFLEGPYDFSACVFQDVPMDGHGGCGLGQNAMKWCIFDGCGAIGSGNWESEIDIEINDCHIKNGTSHGILRGSSIAAKVGSTLIEDCALDAVNITAGGGVLKMQNVVGSGNGGAGLRLTNGAQCLDQGGNSVTGTDGEVIVGGNVASLWADATPRTDVGAADPQFCRIY